MTTKISEKDEQYFQTIREEFNMLRFEKQKLDRKVEETRDKFFSEYKRLYPYSRHQPEINAIGGEIMAPWDCSCNGRGSCLSYCNPYK